MTSKELIKALVADAVYLGRISGTPSESQVSYQAAMLISAWGYVFESIAAQATPHSNATVRRMASMASGVIDEPA